MDADTNHSPDPEKDGDLDKSEPESPTSTSTPTPEHEAHSRPSRPQTAHLRKGADLTSPAAADPEDILTLPHRGRRHSITSNASSDSQRTGSDDDDDDAHDHQVTHHRSRSRARSSTRSAHREAVRVPRADRRGLLARFCLVDEVTHAWHYPRRMKWVLTAVVAAAGAAAPMGSSIVLPALVDIAADFRTTATVVNLSVAMYMLSMSIFPLWWSSFSETLGRRSVYVVSFFLFLVFNVLAAVSTGIGMFVVMRILSGGAAASVQAVGAGTIADIWETKERGKAMGLFYLGPLCGPLLSPILGGVLAQTLGWRASQWFLAIFAGILWVFIVFSLPETLRQRRALATEAEQDVVAAEITTTATTPGEKHDPVRPALTRTPTTTRSTVHVKSRKYLLMARRALIDPLHILLYLRFPAVAMLVALASVTFGALYVLNISVQQTFSAAPYRYDSILVGCLYIPNSAGYFLASVFGGRWVDRIMHREARRAGRLDPRGRLRFLPEDRMQENAWLGALLFPASLLAYGWCARARAPVAAALVCNFFFGVGSMLIFALVTTMLTEFLPRRASSGIALNNFVRNIFSCLGSVVTEPLIRAVGNGWLFTGLCLIGLAAGVSTIWSMKRFGPRWRISMDRRLEEMMGE